jgi:iron complex outermembrane recepter protein
MRRNRANVKTLRRPKGAASPHEPLALHRGPIATAVAAILAGTPLAHAQQVVQGTSESGGLAEVLVTAQKISENVQNVPISIQVLNTQKLEELSVANLDDYVKYMPSVSYSRGQGQGGNGQPGSSHVYMRGVVSGANENHSGSQPSVGTYLDEQPVTTIDGTVDVHVYDIQRIEVLEGPQGTLYGASSEAGTIRIITNKPDPTKFEAGYDVEGNRVQHGGTGWGVEGFVNFPLSPIAAVRLVAWDQHDAGYIDNVAGTNTQGCIVNGIRTFPTWAGQTAGGAAPCPTVGVVGAGAIGNAAYVKNNYNTADTKGGRAALKLDLGDNWTLTPTVMGQSVSSEGFFGYDPAVGDLKVAHFGPESSNDTWLQAALTAEGRLSDFDLVYAGAFMKRTIHSIADYSDYSEFYDRLYGSGSIWQGDNGQPIMPQELVNEKGYFQKWSHELRLTTPQNLPVRGTVGVFIQRQLHDIFQQYVMPGYGFTNPHGDPNSSTPNPNGFASSLSIPTLANTIWLTDEQRVDRDKAVFFQGTWDITPQLALNGGMRFFKFENSLQGFYGYSLNYDKLSGYSSGMIGCFAPATLPFAPCTDLDKTVSDTGNVPRVNLTYKLTPDKLVYATWSKGFRPGGVNRTSLKSIGPYQSDFLTNYEIGWKTQWLDHHLRWNGAVFWEDWKNFQFSFLGPNSVTVIENGGNARIKGIENEIVWAPSSALQLSTNFTFLDPVLTQDVCAGGAPPCPTDSTPIPFGNPNVLVGPWARAGTNLPVTPKFKGNVVARYTFDQFGDWRPFGQVTWMYQTQSTPSLRVDNSQVIGMQRAFGLMDLTAGLERDNMHVQFLVTNVADRRAQLTRFVQCTVNVCEQPYIIPARPRTFAIQFGQKF